MEEDSCTSAHALGGKAGESTGGNESGVGGMQSFVSNAVKGRRERRRGRQPPDVLVTPSKSGELNSYLCSDL